MAGIQCPLAISCYFHPQYFFPFQHDLCWCPRRRRAIAILAVADAGVATATTGLAEDVAAYFSIHQETLRLVAPLQVLTGGENARMGQPRLRSSIGLSLNSALSAFDGCGHWWRRIS